ncbi:MAG: Asp-tRNA(Asn)/Glu-tRNA(Gln) amidotransferase subunit GatC [candidate division WOR-3 bacterium]
MPEQFESDKMTTKLRKNDLDRLLRLIKIDLNEAELELFSSQLPKIVDYFQNLKTLNLQNIEPTSHIVKITCPRRPDRKITCADNVLTKMPWVKFNQFFVPIILDALSE